MFVSIFLVTACQVPKETPPNPRQVPTTNPASPQIMTFGVFPYLSPERLERDWSAITRDLSEAVDIEVRFRTSSNFDGFRENIRAEIYDIAVIQPVDYIQVAAPSGYLPIARLSEPLTGIIVITEGSILQSLEDLAGAVLALPPISAAVSMLARITLQQIGIDPDTDITLNYFHSHDSCLQQILIGTADACVTNIVPLRTFEANMDIDLSILGETISIPHILFVHHPRVPQQNIAILEETILGWQTSFEGRDMLSLAGLSKFIPASDMDYDIVRQYLDNLENQ